MPLQPTAKNIQTIDNDMLNQQVRLKEWLMDQPTVELPKQCKDIPDWVFLSAIEAARTLRGHPDRRIYREATRWDVAAVLAGFPEAVVTGDVFPDEIRARMPENLIRAKALKLINRRLITGCACGCRGDFSLTERGRQWARQ